MSARDKDARAAMRSIIMVTCASQWHAAEGRLDYSMPTGEHIAKLAGEVADAMEAERAKRVPTAAPDTITDKDGTRLTFTPTGDGKVRIHATEPAHELPKTHAELGALIMNVLAKANDDIASLQAVAEAAADLLRFGSCGAGWDALVSALNKACPGWKDKVTP